jgi:hypothetical protein
MALYGAETWTLRAADQKYLKSFEMWCWRMEKNIWIDHDRNEEVLLRGNVQRNILHETRKRKANWICHILRRNCLLKQVIERKITGEMEVTRRWGRGCKKLPDVLKDRRGYSHLKEEALDRTVWKNRFGRGFGPVVSQTEYWMNEFRTCRYLCHLSWFLCTRPANQPTLTAVALCIKRFDIPSVESVTEPWRNLIRGNVVHIRYHPSVSGPFTSSDTVWRLCIAVKWSILCRCSAFTC